MYFTVKSTKMCFKLLHVSFSWKLLIAIAILALPTFSLLADDEALNRAIFLYDKKRYIQALAILDSLVKSSPDDVEVLNNSGLNKFALGDHKGALSDYAKVLSINPRHAKAIVNRGYVKFSEGNVSGAMSDYELALSINPDLAKAYNNRGVAKFFIKDTVGAFIDYDKALSLDSQLAEAYLNRGTAYYHCKNYAFSERDYTNAINIDREYAEAYFGRGLVEYLHSKKNEACSDWNTAFALGYTKEVETVNGICLPDHAEDNLELNPANFSWVSKLRILTETGKWEIKPEYMEIINKVATLLKAYPSMNIEIQGHADSVNRSNDKNLNLKLSQKRAEAVRAIIHDLGISYNRLTANGYGETLPVMSNSTEEGRHQNRRIEFVIERSSLSKR